MWDLALHMEEGGPTAQPAPWSRRVRRRGRAAEGDAANPPTPTARRWSSGCGSCEQVIRAACRRCWTKREAQRSASAGRRRRAAAEPAGHAPYGRQAEQAARQGDMKTAEQRMAELEKMLDALRNARAMTAEEMQRAQQRQRGQQQMGAVQDMIGRQGGLLDHAQRRRPDARPGSVRSRPAIPVLRHSARRRGATARSR